MKLAGSVLEELWFAEDDSDDATQSASQSLAAKLAELQGLKPFPAVAQRTLGLLNSPDYRVSVVARALEEDPSLAAGVVRMANSAMFAGAKPCSSIDQAFMRLGGNAVKEVVVAVATMEMFPDQSGIGKRIRDHCAATAALVQFLAREFVHQKTPGIFLCGLMHDVGKLMLMETGEISYAEQENQDVLAADQLHLVERTTVGYDHAVLGGHILSGWKMPDPIPKVVAWHHQPSRATEDKVIGPMVAVLRIADQLDYRLTGDPDNAELYLEDCAETADASYIQLTAEALKAKQVPLLQARHDALSLFS